MSRIDWGCLTGTLMRGILPTDCSVQVIATKLISDENEADRRYRIMFWDGESLYKHGLLITSTLSPPTKFSIIRIGTDTLPEDCRESCIRKLEKDGQESYAYLFHHYILLQDGTEVGFKLTTQIATNLPLTPKSNGAKTDDGSATGSLSTPPNLSIPGPPPAVRPRTEVSTQERKPNREAVKRNLAESFPSPKRQNTGQSNGSGGGGTEATHQIAGIETFMNKYKIKVRVSQKKDLKEISSSGGWQGKVISCVLSDSTGDIMLKAFNTEAEMLNSTLENGSTYLLTGARITPVRDARFNSTGHHCELTWNQNTQAIGPLLSDPVNIKYKFVPISKLRELEKDSSCDVCAWVQETGNVIEFRSKADKDLKKRELILADDSDGGSSISLTLWDRMAVDFNHNNRVIALKGAKVGEWNNVKNLSIGFSGSYEVEPNNPRVEDLVSWSNILQNSQSQPPSQLNKSSTEEEFTTIQELKDALTVSGGEKRFKLYGWIILIKDENLFYRAHTPPTGTRCNKKVVSGSSGFECSKCVRRDIQECDTTLRFNVRLSIADYTSNSWCSMFDAVSLFNMSAQEMSQLQEADETKFQRKISSKTLQPFIFKVSSKIETYNDAPKLKIVINEVVPISWVEGEAGLPWKDLIKYQISQVHALEAELGVAHDQEYGTTWGESIDI